MNIFKVVGWLITATLAVWAFSVVPTEKVAEFVPIKKSRNVTDKFIDPFNPYEIVSSYPKSGLRKAIEGRLKWLGLGNEFSYSTGCEVSGNVETCERLF